MGDFTSHTMYLQDLVYLALAMHMSPVFSQEEWILFFLIWKYYMNLTHIWCSSLILTEKEHDMTFAAVLERHFLQGNWHTMHWNFMFGSLGVLLISKTFCIAKATEKAYCDNLLKAISNKKKLCFLCFLYILYVASALMFVKRGSYCRK